MNINSLHLTVRAQAEFCGMSPAYSWMNVSSETATPGKCPAPSERSQNLAGWVSRTRPLAEPLSPRGPQPVVSKLRERRVRLNGPQEPKIEVLGFWYR